MDVAMIWDLDGTLLDSYDMIVGCLHEIFMEIGFPMEKEKIRQHTLQLSMKSLLEQVALASNVSVDLLQACYSQLSGSRYLDIKCMENGQEVLQRLLDKGVRHYVYTHRGKTTIPVLENLGLLHYFEEIVTSQNGFSRKPNPEGIQYLLGKYALQPERTYYVGDRRLDMECAKNAGVAGVLYSPAGSVPVDCTVQAYTVRNLLEILTIVE